MGMISSADVRRSRGGGTAWLTWRWLRRRWLGALPLLVIMLVGTTGTIVALGTAQRTSEAFDRYLQRANVGDVVINPSVNSTEVDAVIRSLPGITEVTTESLFMVTNDDGAPRPRRVVDEGGVESGTVSGVFGSHDGRYVDMDRPVIRAGRLPVGPSEVALSVATAEAEGLELGDVVPLAFWRLRVDGWLSPEAAAGEFGDEVITPVGVEHVELVGLITSPGEVLPNELYPSQRTVVSSDVARRYDCLPPPPDPSLSYADNVARSQPPGCAVSYRYYSLSFADGAAGVKPALEEFVRRVRPLNEEMASIRDTSDVGSEPPSYFLIATETEPERRRVDRAIRPTVTAMGVLAAAAGTVTLALAGFAVARNVRHTAATQRQWRQLGMTRGARIAVAAAPLVAAISGGVAGAVVAAYFVGTRPIGLVGVLEPARSLGLSAPSLLAVLAMFVGASVVTVVVIARASRATADEDVTARHSTGRRAWATVGSPPIAEGLRAALARRSSLPVILGSAVVAAVLLAALVFGASLAALVETPRSYGWSWDLAAITGGGYGDLDVAGARAALDDDPAVDTWTALGFLNELSVDGEPVMSIVGVERQTPEVDIPLLSGELPRRSDEVALGSASARERGIDVGDTVSIGGPFEPVDAAVTGIAVFPTIGPMFAGTVGSGDGLLVPQAMIDEVAPVENAAISLATFVGVDLVGDADPAAVARIEQRLGVPDLLGAPPIVYKRAVRPPEIIEAAATRAVPVFVGVWLGVVGALGLGAVSWASVRSRRRDLAVARALGFRPAQVRWSVRTQSLATTLAALAIGVPLGVIAGRLSWQAFARQLGVLPDAGDPWTTIAAVVAAALTLTLIATELPARHAAARRPAAGLRAE
jgi:putative ABC transport system permease protein